jgi:hypothetical protein
MMRKIRIFGSVKLLWYRKEGRSGARKRGTNNITYVVYRQILRYYLQSSFRKTHTQSKFHIADAVVSRNSVLTWSTCRERHTREPYASNRAIELINDLGIDL